MNSEDKLQLEEQILAVLLKNERNAIDEFVESGHKRKNFEEKHRVLLDAILEASDRNVLLTRSSYRAFNERMGRTANKEIMAEESLFNRIVTVTKSKRDDLPTLLDKLRESVISQTAVELINEYSKNIDKSALFAATELQQQLKSVLDDVDVNANVSFDVVGSPAFSAEYREERKKRDNPNPLIQCGINEIDDVMGVGFGPSTLTVVCANVGGFKSTMMLNMALGVYETSKVDVLFIPLEMPRKWVFDQILARETKVPSQYIRSPIDPKTKKRLLSEEQDRKVDHAIDKWASNAHRFAFLEMGDRTTVGAIRRQIDRHLSYHQPRLIVIDYVANLLADKPRKEGNHLEIGDMLKDMIAMGKPGVVTKEGFAILTAAQLNRLAISRMRNQRDQSKSSLGSDDLMGSHHYSMDATNIFGLLEDPSMPKKRIQVIPIKSRYGNCVYKNDSNRAILNVRPEISLIYSEQNAVWKSEAQDEIANMFAANPTIPVIHETSAPAFGDEPDEEESSNVLTGLPSSNLADDFPWITT